MTRKIDVKRILELRNAGMSQNSIAASRHASKHSIGEVFRLADEKGISYDSIANLSPGEVYQMFFPDRHSVETLYMRPDYGYVHKELMRVGVTLKLLWEEYQGKCTAENKIPVGYTKFCEGYREYTIAEKLTNHLEHKPGVVVEVDWSGPTMHYVDMATGEIITVYLFVAVLPYSQYAYVEPALDMKMDTFIRCHIRMYEFFGGVTTRLVCDNLKAGVVSHPKDGEIVLTSDYEALGEHYMTAIMPAGGRKPKQKASVVKRGLEADGILNGTHNSRWHESNIRQILTNEKYIGDVLLQKTYTVSILEKKRSVNNGTLPKYYVEGSHEAIIDKDVFLRVQAEIVRRANILSDGKKRVYSGRYALSSIVFCGHCGVSENIRSVLGGGVDDKIAEIDGIIREKQAELLDAGNDEGRIDSIGDEIMRLREERQNLLTETVMKQELQNRMEDMAAFLDSQIEAVTEYSDVLVRRLVEKITVYDEKLTVEFKSGFSIDVDA